MKWNQCPGSNMGSERGPGFAPAEPRAPPRAARCPPMSPMAPLSPAERQVASLFPASRFTREKGTVREGPRCPRHTSKCRRPWFCQPRRPRSSRLGWERSPRVPPGRGWRRVPGQGRRFQPRAPLPTAPADITDRPPRCRGADPAQSRNPAATRNVPARTPTERSP